MMETVILILSGMATCLPLAVTLVQYVAKALREKNWGQLVSLTIELMGDAEGLFVDGESKKDWVVSGLKNLSGYIDYDLDEETVSKLIDSLCDLSKAVNAA